MLQTNGSTERTTMNGVGQYDSPADLFTDYLIVGTGPAGASLACFLAQHGKLMP